MGVAHPVKLQSIDALILALHGRYRSLTAAEVSTLRDYADLIVEYIQDRWPVDTGTSRDAWEYDLYVHPPGIGFEILNEMDYAPYVAEAGTGGAPLHERLVPEAVNAYAAEMVAELSGQIRREEARRVARSMPRPPAPATLWGRRGAT